ncbi:MAG: NADH-quinone oxidoreductase subunit L [Dehalococcoidales bacterium]|nr:NADH-quinone oxidoreductase subunit L [Dehalococcoidales bacterium]
MPYQLAWFIFLIPFFSFLVIALFIKPFVKVGSRVAGYITIGAVGTCLALSLWTLLTIAASPEHKLAVPAVDWVVIEKGVTIQVGLMIDSLTAVMLIVVTVVSLMVQIYSQGYMHGDPGYHRYYAWMSLFTASMLGLILSNNLLFMFVFWEMVGLCSYLLIGFWFHRPSAANAAKKAFIVTRLGDFGFLVGILALYNMAGTFDIAQLNHLAVTGVLAGAGLTWAAIGIFSGAMGKSAQFPLHVWLPDAMEGPTPVSALIHAATMVAAGVFLVARMLPLFASSLTAITVVAVIGAFTAIFAASIGLVMTDIKRVVAYSTISQLGYMMLGLGAAGLALRHEGKFTLELATAAAAIGIFHLFNHAFFKALLFLGSGSVNHTTGTFDMRLMGGLRKVMPYTYVTFLIASLSLAGIWPLAGFWSKDEILAIALETQPVLFVLAMITVFMTAFYIFRVVFLTFGGEYRGVPPDEHAEHGTHGGTHLHESPRVMVAPLVILCVFAIGSGWFNVTGGFARFMGEEAEAPGLFAILTHPLPLISLLVALSGIGLAYATYSAKWLSAENMGKMFKPLYVLFSHKYYFDELYQDIIVRKLLLNGLFAVFQKIDSGGVDGTVNGIARGVTATGRGIRRAQTGQLQFYGLFIGIGVVAIAVCLYLFR